MTAQMKVFPDIASADVLKPSHAETGTRALNKAL